MLTLALLVVAAAVVGKMAAIEGRNPLLWGICAGGAGWVVAGQMGMWAIAAPALVLVGGFVGLFVANMRNEDDGRGGRRIR